MFNLKTKNPQALYKLNVLKYGIIFNYGGSILLPDMYTPIRPIRILYFLKTERPKFNNMLNLKIFRVVRNANSISIQI